MLKDRGGSGSAPAREESAPSKPTMREAPSMYADMCSSFFVVLSTSSPTVRFGSADAAAVISSAMSTSAAERSWGAAAAASDRSSALATAGPVVSGSSLSELDGSVSASSTSAPSATAAEAGASALPVAAADAPMAAACGLNGFGPEVTHEVQPAISPDLCQHLRVVPALVVSREDPEDGLGGDNVRQQDTVRSFEEPDA